MDAAGFSLRWSDEPISERAHYQSFVSQLCRLIGVPAPDDEKVGDLDYCFERAVRFDHGDGTGHSGFIDCYRRGSFVMEIKQSAKRRSGGYLDPAEQLALFGAKASAGAERLMSSARRQAENYARALDEWPPFLILIDIGRSIELWADFARVGKGYKPFPDRNRYRLSLDDLSDPAVRDLLRQVWLEPMSLDPSRHMAAVTVDIAERLAWLVRSIGARAPKGADRVERAAHTRKTGLFVMQCIFAMFADSIGLIQDGGFRRFIEGYRGRADQFHRGARDFFHKMDTGGYFPALHQELKRFNGGLFAEDAALPVTETELEALIAAAGRDWASVEPAMFGALLEGALDPDERARLGAHYTPRAFVERLVGPTLMEPLRTDWEAAEAAAIGRLLDGDVRGARRVVRDFHQALCRVRVLDPACGTANFLYVAMLMMKALEDEVLAVLAELGEVQDALDLDGHTVSLTQFLGLEKNATAVGIARMVMWIGYLQWRHKAYGRVQPSEPILRHGEQIVEADALLTARRDLKRDEGGRPLTNGKGEEAEAIEAWLDARATPWPDADFIIGNPPFMGAKDMRTRLGDGYVDALWAIRQGRFRSADLVTAWWDRAADMLKRKGSRLRRFGFITTNSITQTFSRRVLEHHLKGEPPLRLVFACADHPWVAGAGAADVRIAMTVVERGEPDGQARLMMVTDERRGKDGVPDIETEMRRGVISAALTVGADLTTALPLKANSALCSPGVKLHGAGFIVTPVKAAALSAASDPPGSAPIRPYVNGRDLADRPRGVMAIDLFGWAETEARRRHPGVWQHLLETVKPGRDRNARDSYRDAWWVFGEPRRELREALNGLSRCIVTAETAKHRWFRFLDAEVLADNKLVVVASDDPFVLGVLSSRAHRAWFLANAARIGGNATESVYVKSACFDPFPFPEANAAAAAEIAALAEELDSLRAGVFARHPDLTMTGLYNARDLMTSGKTMSEAERSVHERGCVALLDHLHHRLDAAVERAFGWPEGMDDAARVARLLSLNAARAEDERRGRVLWLRPGFQKSRVAASPAPVQTEAQLLRADPARRLPETQEGMARVLLDELRAEGRPVKPRALAGRFQAFQHRRTERRIEQTLAVLAVAGSVQRTPDGWFAPRDRA